MSLLESTGKWGGNAAMSGGGMWLPNNPLMQRDGAGDSREEALTYLKATVGDVGPAQKRAARKLSSTAWPTSSKLPRSMASSWCEPRDYPDYYPELPGGKVGRAVEVEALRRPSGSARDGTLCQAPVAMPIKTDDDLGCWAGHGRPQGGFVRGAQLVLRTLGAAARGQRVAGIGAALAAAFFDVVVQKQQGSALARGTLWRSWWSRTIGWSVSG